MKGTIVKSVSFLILAGLMTLLLAAGAAMPAAAAGPGQQRSAGTPTPVPTPTARPILSYLAGSLLKGSDAGVFYLAEDGTRRHIHNWDTFLALGFDPEQIIEVEDEFLEAIRLNGELTRLIFDEEDNLYWVAGGRRWQVSEWREVVTGSEYTGVPATRPDAHLLDRLPLRDEFEDGALLREGHAIYYFDHTGALPAGPNAQVIPLPAGARYDEARVIDVPFGVLSVYRQQDHLAQLQIWLKDAIQAANVRQGPGLQYPVITSVGQTDRLAAQGRNEAGNWLKIQLRDEPGWIAASLVAPQGLLALLPVVDAGEVVAPLPQAEPAALVETNTPEPLNCIEVPIRGFGQVWGDHPGIQAELGCPYTWNGGEQATNAAVQTFEHGLMVWLAADGQTYQADPVYVFFEDGTYQRFGDLGPADPAKIGPVPEGFFAVGDRFSKVYWEGTGARVKERLGYATGEAMDSPGAYQEFQYGRMFWLGAVDQIFVVIRYSQSYELTNRYYAFTDCFELACD